MTQSLAPSHAPTSPVSHDVQGVEIVVPASEDCLTPGSRRLISALHRRVWQRGTARPGRIDFNDDASTSRPLTSDVDLSEVALSDWSLRCASHRSLLERNNEGLATRVRIRGWSAVESAILVDGYVAPGCLVDLAVAADAFTDRLRNGERTLAIIHPRSASSDEVFLWADALRITEDRLGIERGVLVFRSDDG